VSVPTGKGVLIWKLSSCAGGDPVALAEKAVAAGFAWVAIKVQGWMNDTQTGLQDAAEQALSNAQQAAKDEITRQADQTIQGALEKAETLKRL